MTNQMNLDEFKPEYGIDYLNYINSNY